jgi:hypothetical protein
MKQKKQKRRIAEIRLLYSRSRLRSIAVGAIRFRGSSALADSKQAAKEFFTDELLERIAGLYGVRPSIEFAEVVTLVEKVRP